METNPQEASKSLTYLKNHLERWLKGAKTPEERNRRLNSIVETLTPEICVNCGEEWFDHERTPYKLTCKKGNTEYERLQYNREKRGKHESLIEVTKTNN